MNVIGPYSRPAALSKLDGRTKEARMLRDMRKALVAHVGGQPSVVQNLAIDRVVNLALRVAMMDRKFAQTGEMTPHDTATYLAWTSCLERCARQLGFKGTPPKPPSLADIRAGRA